MWHAGHPSKRDLKIRISGIDPLTPMDPSYQKLYVGRVYNGVIIWPLVWIGSTELTEQINNWRPMGCTATRIFASIHGLKMSSGLSLPDLDWRAFWRLPKNDVASTFAWHDSNRIIWERNGGGLFVSNILSLYPSCMELVWGDIFSFSSQCYKCTQIRNQTETSILAFIEEKISTILTKGHNYWNFVFELFPLSYLFNLK